MELHLKDHYQWVVLGDHPGALMSAALMSAAGFSVVVLPLSPSSLATVSDTQQFIDHESNFLLGLDQVGGQAGFLQMLFRRLGWKDLEFEKVFVDDQVLPEIVTPNYRFGIRKEDAALKREIVRELGESAAEESGLVEALKLTEKLGIPFWRDLPLLLLEQSESKRPGKRQFKVQRAIDRFRLELQKQMHQLPKTSRRWFQNRPLQSSQSFEELLQGLHYSVTSSLEDQPNAVDLIQLMALTRTGGGLKGGMTAFRDLLFQQAKRLGASVPKEIQCQRIFIESGRLVGVQVTHKGKMISVEGGILGCSINHAKEFFYFSGEQKRHRLKEPPKPLGWKFSIALTVHEKAIPEGMRSRLIWKEQGAPFIEVEVGDPNAYEFGDPSHRFLFLRTILPYSSESIEPEYQRNVAIRMFRQLREVIPFLDFHVVQVFPDFREAVQCDHLVFHSCAQSAVLGKG